MTNAVKKFSLPLGLLILGSVGVAGYALIGYTIRPLGSLVHPEMKNINDLMSRADEALYEAKESGRNRAIVATQLTEKN